jgi:hypothetical protein
MKSLPQNGKLFYEKKFTSLPARRNEVKTGHCDPAVAGEANSRLVIPAKAGIYEIKIRLAADRLAGRKVFYPDAISI